MSDIPGKILDPLPMGIRLMAGLCNSFKIFNAGKIIKKYNAWTKRTFRLRTVFSATSFGSNRERKRTLLAGDHVLLKTPKKGDEPSVADESIHPAKSFCRQGRLHGGDLFLLF